MNRWLLVVLLLLVPFTLAPRTSLNPDGSNLELTGVLSRSQIPVGGTVNLVIQARNTTTETADNARLDIALLWRGDASTLRLRTSPFCGVAQDESPWMVHCNLGSLRPGQAKTIHITARALVEGDLVFDPVASSNFGAFLDDVPQRVTVAGGRG